MPRTVYVAAPSRLHFGFVDTSEDGRLMGSAGVALDNPRLRFRLSNQGNECLGPCSEELLAIAKKCSEGECDELDLNVLEHIPRHVGLGSGTQMCLASGKAAHVLTDRECNVEELATAFRRGRRSRVGIDAFVTGGFVLCSNGDSRRFDVPEQWRFIVAVPNGQELIHGKAEGSKLKGVRPLTPQEKERLDSTRSDLIRSLEKEDVELFGDAVSELDNITGAAFSPVQDGQYSNPLVEKGLQIAKDSGAHGGGQSSWGPGFFAVTKSEKAGNEVMLSLFDYLDSKGGGEVYLASPENRGASFSMVEQD